MFFMVPLMASALMQFPGSSDGAQLSADPEVILIDEEVREIVLLAEPRDIEFATEPRRMDISDVTEDMNSVPRERTR